MKAARIAQLGLAIAVAIAIGVVTGWLIRPDNERDLALADRARNHCGMVYWALESDVRDLTSNDPKRQRVAADRFADFTTFHSEHEIVMCSENPPDLQGRDACWLKYDYECLANLARNAAAHVGPRPAGPAPSLE